MIQPAHSRPSLVVHGAGGHGCVVADAALAGGLTVLGFLDDAPASKTCGRQLDPNDSRLLSAVYIVAIGDNAARQAVAQRLGQAGHKLTNVIHPDATVSAKAVLNEGIYVGARAVVGPNAILDSTALINTGAVIEHDCKVGMAAHIAPGALLGGGVTIGDGALVGMGARVLPGLSVGHNAIIGAGAVLTCDAEPGSTYVGVPARSKNK
ncbi:MAG: acetyltransferase [Algisphaera sp.]